jgi:multidrug efflux system outer membrane protein
MRENFNSAASGLSALTAACLLAACSMAPVYERPAAPIASSWPQPGSAQAQPAPALLDWNALVTDEALRQTIALALANNRDLRQTLLDIDAARAQYRVQRADRLPGLGLQADATRQRLPAALSAAGVAATQGSYQVGLGMTAFELDLFGRVRSLSDAALQQYLAVEHSAQTARISLVGEVMQAWITRDGAQRQRAWTQKTLDSRQGSLDLVAQRRQAGAASALDYQEALGLREQAAADLQRMEREARLAEHALRLLVGSAQASLQSSGSHGSFLVQDIAAAAPSTLLERRPDILAAEHALRARNADIGAARAAFFPRISLTGFFGASSAELSGLFDAGSRSWSFAPQLVLPIFDGARNRANLDLAQVRKDIAVAKYEGAIQTAFREVADALAATDTLRREELSRLALARSSEEALRLSEARYRAGVDSHLRYLEAQRSAFSHQLSAIEVGTQRQLALVQLFKALGGGWSGAGQALPAAS